MPRSFNCSSDRVMFTTPRNSVHAPQPRPKPSQQPRSTAPRVSPSAPPHPPPTHLPYAAAPQGSAGPSTPSSASTSRARPAYPHKQILKIQHRLRPNHRHHPLVARALRQLRQLVPSLKTQNAPLYRGTESMTRCSRSSCRFPRNAHMVQTCGCRHAAPLLPGAAHTESPFLQVYSAHSGHTLPYQCHLKACRLSSHNPRPDS